MGKLFFSLAGCWFIVALEGTLDIAFMLVSGILLFFILIIGAAVYANTGNRYRK